ncbi:MAG: adenylate/guanylate cyclase domain-containing protein, partial [Myroides sp.]
PLENDNHAKKMIEVALEMCDFITSYQEERRKADKPYFEIKIGINSGEVVAGIVGIKKFAYDIWGDAVNTAARMKARSENGKINVGSTTYELAKSHFDFSYRGELEIKGKGLAKMYFVETKTN